MLVSRRTCHAWYNTPLAGGTGVPAPKCIYSEMNILVLRLSGLARTGIVVAGLHLVTVIVNGHLLDLYRAKLEQIN